MMGGVSFQYILCTSYCTISILVSSYLGDNGLAIIFIAFPCRYNEKILPIQCLPVDIALFIYNIIISILESIETVFVRG